MRARVRRNVGRLRKPLVHHASKWASMAAGAAIGLASAAITLANTDSDPAPGVVAVFWVACGFCAAFAICFGIVGFETKEAAERAGHPV